MELGIPEILLALITVLSPLISAVAIQSKWNDKTKNAVAFGVSLVIAVGYLVLTGGITDWSNIPAAVLAVYGLQQLVYMQLLRQLSKKVEAATSVKSGEAVVVQDGQANVVLDTGVEQGQVVVVGDEQPEVRVVADPPVNEDRADTDPNNPVG